MYRLACKDGVLIRCFHRSNISVLPETPVELMGLSDILKNWRTAKQISLRAAAKKRSVVMSLRVKCSCQYTCESNRCCCLEYGFLCTSACHPRNTKCKNKEKECSKPEQVILRWESIFCKAWCSARRWNTKFLPNGDHQIWKPKRAWINRCTKNVFQENNQEEISKEAVFAFSLQMLHGSLFQLSHFLLILVNR